MCVCARVMCSSRVPTRKLRMHVRCMRICVAPHNCYTCESGAERRAVSFASFSLSHSQQSHSLSMAIVLSEKVRSEICVHASGRIVGGEAYGKVAERSALDPNLCHRSVNMYKRFDFVEEWRGVRVRETRNGNSISDVRVRSCVRAGRSE